MLKVTNTYELVGLRPTLLLLFLLYELSTFIVVLQSVSVITFFYVFCTVYYDF